MAYKALRAIQSVILIFPVIFFAGRSPGGPSRSVTNSSAIFPAPGNCPDRNQTENVFWKQELVSCQFIQVNGRQVALPGPGEEIGVIVELAGESIAAFRAHLQTSLPLSPGRQDLAVTHHAEQLRAWREKTIQGLKQSGLIISTGHSYSYVFNGFQATMLMENLDALSSQPNVAAVDMDYAVHALLDESVPLIGADQVWLMQDSAGENVTGAGVEVAIIDTGIDYTHPDLGAGFGPGNKVAGGYDFVNTDADPVDDNGHGTHVAGIVAAKGTLNGVAPDTTLFAYKVLDDSGSGYTGDVIAGIEMAADPDGNPLTEDAHEVINLSLGGHGSPDDAMAQAVENAVQSGILVVAAAGNNGPAYGTTESPGVSPAAVTVGATDKLDALADFSSRGPVQNFYGLVKPDILAPGVNIYSTVPVEGEHGDPSRYAVLSGTSMAAPHIAGAAALIKQLHPNWTPRMIRAALTNQALDLNLNVFAQGAGRVRVHRSAQAEFLANPGLLSFGWVDNALASWSRTKTITVTNLGHNTSEYSLQLQEALPAGAALTVTPASFNLEPGESQVVSAKLEVNNAVLPIKDEDPFNYEGSLAVQSASQTALVRFSFFKSPVLHLTFDEVPESALVYNGADFFWWADAPQGLGAENAIMLKPGEYDIIALYDGWFTQIFRELVPVETTASVAIQKSEAKNAITIRPVDIHGNLILDGDYNQYFIRPTFIMGIGITGSLEDLRFNYSDISSRYPLVWSSSNAIQNIGPIYDIFGQMLDGINASRHFENDPADFNRIVLRYYPPAAEEKLSIIHFNDYRVGGSGAGNATYSPHVEPLRAPFVKELFIFSPSEQNSAEFGFSEEIGVTEGIDLARLLLVTPYITAYPTGLLQARWCLDQEPVFSTDLGYLPVGLGPPHWYGRFDNQEAALRLFGFQECDSSLLFLNQAQDVSVYPDLSYALYKGEELVQEGVLPGAKYGFYGDHPALEVPLASPGRYSFQVTFPHYEILSKPGVAFLTAEFDTQKNDRNPPMLLSLNVLDDGILANSLPVHAESQIQFSVRDDVQLDQVNLYYRSLTEAAWHKLPVDAAGDQYTAAIPMLPAGTWVDLRIESVDASGNRLEYEVRPGFRIRQSMFLPVAMQRAVP